MKEYDYNLIANFNVNIRVERHRVISTGENTRSYYGGSFHTN